MKAGVLLTDAQSPSAAATCRCLHSHGYRVVTATSVLPAPGQWTRYSSARVKLGNPREAPRRFAEEVGAVADETSCGIVLPGSEGPLLALSEHRDALPENVRLGLPARSVVDRCVNKVAMLDEAAAVGLAPPPTAVCQRAGQARQLAEEVGFPVLLKPRSTVFEHRGARMLQKVFVAADHGELEERLDSFGLPCLIQRFETGGRFSVGGVFAEGRLLSWAFSRYVRTWPPQAGSTCFSRTEADPPDLLEKIATMLGTLGWQGIFEFEVIRSQAGGFAAIDLNPRLYDSVGIAIRAGAPLPAIWCDWLLGRERRLTARSGVYYRWEEAEALHFLVALGRGEPRRALSISRRRNPVEHAYLRWDDPGPAVARALALIRRLARRAAKVLRPI